VREDDVRLDVDAERLGVLFRAVEQVVGGVVCPRSRAASSEVWSGTFAMLTATTVPSRCLAMAEASVIRCSSVAGFASGTITR